MRSKKDLRKKRRKPRTWWLSRLREKQNRTACQSARCVGRAIEAPSSRPRGPSPGRFQRRAHLQIPAAGGSRAPRHSGAPTRPGDTGTTFHVARPRGCCRDLCALDARSVRPAVIKRQLPPCPKCHHPDRVEEEDQSGSSDRWFVCVRCGLRFSPTAKAR